MQDISEFVEAYVRAHYEPETVCVEANCFTLTDGTEIFPTSLFSELLASPEAEWSVITHEWFGMLDLIRARIASTG